MMVFKLCKNMHPGLSYLCLCTVKHDLAKIRKHVIIPHKLRITLIMPLFFSMPNKHRPIAIQYTELLGTYIFKSSLIYLRIGLS